MMNNAKTLLFLAPFAMAQHNFFAQKGYIVDPVSIGLAAVAGTAHGFNQVISHHYHAGFKRVHPNADDYFFNPALSWRRKPVFGYKFDAYHISNSVAQISAFGSGYYAIKDFKKPWKVGINFALCFVSYSLTNYVIYDVVYKQK